MSKLNVDQKTIKDLFQDKRADFLITSVPMRGVKLSVRPFGMISFHSQFQTKDAQNLTVIVNTFSDQLLLSKIVSPRWK